MKNQIHGEPGYSSYFGGAYRDYGMNQWNVKIYSASDEELETLRDYFLCDKEYIRDEFGIDLKNVWFAGRSGGWLVIDETLTEIQIERINETIRLMKQNYKQLIKDITED